MIYFDIYLQYFLVSFHHQKFSIGFLKITSVVGNEVYDWYAFEAKVEYKNGYTSGSGVQ